MAKKTFVMYESWGAAISRMDNEQAGALIKAIYEYQNNPDACPDDPSVAFVFEIIRQKMDEDKRKYDEMCQARSEAGRRGGKSNAKQTEANKANASFAKQTEANKADTDTESDTDTDTESEYESDTENESENEHPTGAKKKSAQARPSRHKYGQFGHVLLTDDQFDALVAKHGSTETENAIRAVDEYCEQSGKTYRNYALVMEKWGYRSADEHARSGTTSGYVDAIQHRFDPINDWLQEGSDDTGGV